MAMRLLGTLLLGALLGCAARKPVHVWPDPAETARWQWDYLLEDAQGCRIDPQVGLDFRCEVRHGAKL